MEPLEYKDVLGGSRVFASWLNNLRNQSGAYVIRKKSNHEILYKDIRTAWMLQANRE